MTTEEDGHQHKHILKPLFGAYQSKQIFHDSFLGQQNSFVDYLAKLRFFSDKAKRFEEKVMLLMVCAPD